MGSISKQGDKFRASLCVNRLRKTKVLPTLHEAEKWIEVEEARLRVRSRSRIQDAELTLLSRLPIRMLAAIESIKYSHQEVCSGCFPYAIESGVYFLIRDDQVIYVGQSVNVLDRIAKHRREGKWFDGFNIIPCPREQMDELETAYINAFAPKYNAMIGPSKNRKRFARPVTRENSGLASA